MKPLIVIILLSLAFFACGNNAKEQQASDLAFEEYEMSDTTYQMHPPPPPNQERNEKNNNDVPAITKYDWDKKIIKNAVLNADVKDYKSFTRSIKEKVKKHGGYISSEQESTNEYHIQNSVQIKVPVQQFDAAMNDILNDAAAVKEKQVSSDDVTTEFIDGKARLEAKKQVRLKYLELLQKAKNMSEIIEVQKEINAIQEEIELVNGRLNYLSHSAAMSTINFTYQQVLTPQPTTDNYSFFTRIKEAFTFGWRWIGELFIVLIAVWPLLLVLIIATIIWRKKLAVKWNKKAVL